jgi:hypothetical protein
MSDEARNSEATEDVNAELQAVYAEAAALEAHLAQLQAERNDTGVRVDSGIVTSSSVTNTLSKNSVIDENDDDTEGSESEENLLDEVDTCLEDSGVVTAAWLDDEEAKRMFGDVAPARKASMDAPLRFEILPQPQSDTAAVGKADVGASLYACVTPSLARAAFARALIMSTSPSSVDFSDAAFMTSHATSSVFLRLGNCIAASVAVTLA